MKHKISPWDYLDRFLILGTEKSTYYASNIALTREAAKNVQHLLGVDGVRVVNRVVEISDSGRAPKNDPALFVLAMASASNDEKTRAASFAALPKVARIGTHLFHYAEFVDGMRGWGRALRKAVANWYLEQPVDNLVNQVIKYQQRDGWSHRDLLRLSHVKTNEMERDAIFRWVASGMDSLGNVKQVYIKGDTRFERDVDGLTSYLPDRISAFEELKKTTDIAKACEIIRQYNMLRETVPTELLTNRDIWAALEERMPMTALIRNLSTMTRVGLFNDSEKVESVMNKLLDAKALKKGRIHPVTLLNALMTYSKGHGMGSTTWKPNDTIKEAIEESFYLSFGSIEPTGKNVQLAIDVSASMTWGNIAGINNLNPRTASAVMAMVTKRVETNSSVVGFCSGNQLLDVKINEHTKINDACRIIGNMQMGSTDCALPMMSAARSGDKFDAFVMYTDSETNSRYNPARELVNYRMKSGIADAKLIVVGMISTDVTVADPQDGNMLDIVGFDGSAPQIMSDFIRG